MTRSPTLPLTRPACPSLRLSRRRLLAAAVALPAAALPIAGPAEAAPASRLIDQRWTRFGTAPDPDHADWDAFLSRHLITGTASGVNLVYYEGAVGDRMLLDRYCDAMQAVDPAALSRPAAMAYWINLYNAVTVRLVLEAWPVKSIKSVRGGLFNTGPWDEDVVRVAGQDLSLNDIEHGILRPVWGDPRIHYAVNCASIGCPNLAPQAYRSDRAEAMLEAGAADYVGHPRGVEVTAKGLVVSSIYDWFKADFGGTDAGVVAHLAAHAGPEKRAAIEAAGRIAGDRYDWSINAAKMP